MATYFTLHLLDYSGVHNTVPFNLYIFDQTLHCICDVYILDASHGCVDHVFGIKDLFEIEADLNTRKSNITFLKRSIPKLPIDDHKLRPKERRLTIK